VGLRKKKSVMRTSDAIFGLGFYCDEKTLTAFFHLGKTFYLTNPHLPAELAYLSELPVKLLLNYDYTFFMNGHRVDSGRLTIGIGEFPNNFVYKLFDSDGKLCVYKFQDPSKFVVSPEDCRRVVKLLFRFTKRLIIGTE
jgi:hypothetical protein